MVIIQYPYKLKVLIQTEAIFVQETAEWIQGFEEWQEWGKCRDEISNATIVSKEDGAFYQYSAIVYCPKSINKIDKGAKIQIWHGDELRLEGEVRRFSKDQLHTRIWV